MTELQPLKDATNIKQTESNPHDREQETKLSTDATPHQNTADSRENIKENANTPKRMCTEDKGHEAGLLDLKILKGRLTETEARLMEKTVQLHVILRVLDKYRRKCTVTDGKLKKIIETATSSSNTD